MDINKIFNSKGINPLDYHIDHETSTIYVKDLYAMGQKLGLSWSRLATEAEWNGWRVIGGDPK